MADQDEWLEPIATAVADGAPIDWTAAAREAGAARETVEQLRNLAVLRRDASPPGADRSAAPHIHLPRRVLTIVVAVATLKLLLALAGMPFASPTRTGSSTPTTAHHLQLLTFGVSGLILIYGGRRDPRARALGCSYLLMSNSTTHRQIEALASTVSPSLLDAATIATRAVSTEAFLPVFFLIFAAGFPAVRHHTRAHAAILLLQRVALLTALLLTALNVAFAWPGVDPRLHALGAAFEHSHDTYFWQAVNALLVSALGLIVWKSRAAPPDERRRVRLLVGGIAVGLAPILFFSFLLGPLSPYPPRFSPYEMQMIGAWLVWPFFFSIPVTTAYAVLVERVLDVRLLIDRVFTHDLATRAIRAASMLPLAGFVLLAWIDRTHTVKVLTGSNAGFVVGLLIAVSMLVWIARPYLLKAADLLLLRERRDPRSVLAGFARELRGALGARDVAAITRRHVQMAFKAEDAAVLVREPHRGTFVPLAGRAPALPIDSALAVMLGSAPAPVEIGARRGDPLLPLLSPAERGWLSDTGFRVLVPLPASDGELLGVLAMCERRGAVPFSADDLLLATSVAAAAATTIEHRRLQERPWADGAAEPPPAAECPACALVHDADTAVCACGAPLAGARVPRLLAGKFRSERRLGAGAMGIVYAGTDAALDRPVAIKALPRLSPGESARLRSEARAMARVSHPNLAIIFALETWRGSPLLVAERLHGGTLADRLREGPLDPATAVCTIAPLADGLVRLHAAGLLHGDVKPSNVGFTSEGVPKLIDFGLARVRERDPALSLTADSEEAFAAVSAGPGGTPLYVPPEVLAGAPVDTASDLWSLNLTLYESIAGSHPFRRATAEQSIAAVRRGVVPDLRDVRPDVAPLIARYFHRALARDAARRPVSAAEIRDTLAAILAELA